jgi:hypothetical protein
LRLSLSLPLLLSLSWLLSLPLLLSLLLPWPLFSNESFKNRHFDRSGSQIHREPRSGETSMFTCGHLP